MALVKRLLTELQAALTALNPYPDKKAEAMKALRDLIVGVKGSTKVIGVYFKPSAMAVLGLLTELTGALKNGAAFFRGLQVLAAKIGPDVAALVRDL